jgi:branched-chain amino acid transport system substrate-binding protein
MSIDSNTVERFAASCARQGYRPIISTGAASIADRFKENPNLSSMTASSNVFPYFQRGTPATDEFQDAVQRFKPGPPGVGMATGWVAGKLFERAVQLGPPSAEVTSETLLAGLWAMKDETLGGLTQPLTYVKGAPAVPSACWFHIRVINQAWASPDRFQLHCRPLPAQNG